jgi:cytochrome c-type biogenesis protein CcmF
VHSFAYSEIGPSFFAFLAIVLFASISLFVYRLPRLRPEQEFDSVASREGSFLANNLVLTGIAFATFWGTLFPIISQVVRGQTMTVGPAFYQQVNGPLFLLLIVLMGMGPLLAWRRASAQSIWRNIRWPALFAAVVAVVLPLLGTQSLWAVLGFAACTFTAATIVYEVWRGVRVRHGHGENYLTAFGMLVSRHRVRYGGYLVHIGLVVLALGVIGSYFFQQQRDAVVLRGQSTQLAGFTLTYEGISDAGQNGIETILTHFTLSRDGQKIGDIYPGERIFTGFEDQPTSVISITTHGLNDLYVFLSGFDDTNSATIRIFYNPLVPLVWSGGVLMLLGGIFCWWPERRRITRVAGRERQTARVEVAV